MEFYGLKLKLQPSFHHLTEGLQDPDRVCPQNSHLHPTLIPIKTGNVYLIPKIKHKSVYILYTQHPFPGRCLQENQTNVWPCPMAVRHTLSLHKYLQPLGGTLILLSGRIFC